MEGWQSWSLFGGDVELEKQFDGLANLISADTNSQTNDGIFDGEVLNVPELESNLELDNETLGSFMSHLWNEKPLTDGSIAGNTGQAIQDLDSVIPVNGNDAHQLDIKMKSGSFASLFAQQKYIEESTLAFYNQNMDGRSSENFFLQNPTPGTSKQMQLIHVDVKPDVASLRMNIYQETQVDTGKKVEPTDANVESHRPDNKKKRIRKYELQDTNDRTVKNARAAKLNRDRKKKEMEELRNTNNKIQSDFYRLSAELQQERSARDEVEKQLAEIREKNKVLSGLVLNGTNLKEILEGVVEGVNQKFRNNQSLS